MVRHQATYGPCTGPCRSHTPAPLVCPLQPLTTLLLYMSGTRRKRFALHSPSMCLVIAYIVDVVVPLGHHVCCSLFVCSHISSLPFWGGSHLMSPALTVARADVGLILGDAGALALYQSEAFRVAVYRVAHLCIVPHCYVTCFSCCAYVPLARHARAAGHSTYHVCH
jgi:hypothetical protein